MAITDSLTYAASLHIIDFAADAQASSKPLLQFP